ncbi:MAG: NAD-dependent epimerase/dehydratase family protein [Caldilineaceae bacterium]
MSPEEADAGVWTVRDFAEHGTRSSTWTVVRREPLPGSFIKLDLTDAGEVYDASVQTQPDAVCHLAANPSPSGFRQQTFANNVLSTYNVMQAAGDNGKVTRFVYVPARWPPAG